MPLSALALWRPPLSRVSTATNAPRSRIGTRMVCHSLVSVIWHRHRRFSSFEMPRCNFAVHLASKGTERSIHKAFAGPAERRRDYRRDYLKEPQHRPAMFDRVLDVTVFLRNRHHRRSELSQKHDVK